jgi:hypothetical protein
VRPRRLTITGSDEPGTDERLPGRRSPLRHSATPAPGGGTPMAATRIFVNLPITDQATTRAFWTALGYTFNARPSHGRR